MTIRLAISCIFMNGSLPEHVQFVIDTHNAIETRRAYSTGVQNGVLLILSLSLYTYLYA